MKNFLFYKKTACLALFFVIAVPSNMAAATSWFNASALAVIQKSKELWNKVPQNAFVYGLGGAAVLGAIYYLYRQRAQQAKPPVGNVADWGQFRGRIGVQPAPSLVSKQSFGTPISLPVPPLKLMGVGTQQSSLMTPQSSIMPSPHVPEFLEDVEVRQGPAPALSASLPIQSSDVETPLNLFASIIPIEEQIEIVRARRLAQTPSIAELENALEKALEEHGKDWLGNSIYGERKDEIKRWMRLGALINARADQEKEPNFKLGLSPNEEVRALMWYYYAIAAFRGEDFEEGAFQIRDIKGNIYNLLLKKAKARPSSHLKEYYAVTGDSYTHYGFDVTDLPPNAKKTVLFGWINKPEKRLFIKPENFGVNGLDILAHAFEFVIAQLSKLFTPGSDDSPIYRKERVPSDLRALFKNVVKQKYPEQADQMIKEANGRGIGYIYQMVQKMVLEKKLNGDDQLVKYLKEYASRNPDLRIGREVIIDMNHLDAQLKPEDLKQLEKEFEQPLEQEVLEFNPMTITEEPLHEADFEIINPD